MASEEQSQQVWKALVDNENLNDQDVKDFYVKWSQRVS